MYKEELALNNLQWLICHKAKLNHIQDSMTRSKLCLWSKLTVTNPSVLYSYREIVLECVFVSNFILAATPHKVATIRPPASHHENYPS